MKNKFQSRFTQCVVYCVLLFSVTLFSGCDLLTVEDDEEPACEGDVALITRFHNIVTGTEVINDPGRNCYTFGLIEQRNLRTITGALEASNIYIELNGNPMGGGAYDNYVAITLTASGKDFFEASLTEITATFTRLDANKLPAPGDKYIDDFEMVKIDPVTRQISFSIMESRFVTGNYTWFVYEPYEIINLVVPENP